MHKIKKYQLGKSLDINYQLPSVNKLAPNLQSLTTTALTPPSMPLFKGSLGNHQINDIKNLNFKIDERFNKPNTTSIIAKNLGDLFVNFLSGTLSDGLIGDDSELGRSVGNIMSGALGTAGSTIIDNISKGNVITEGLQKNVGSTVSGIAGGLAANYAGQGISSLMGNSNLGKFTGGATSSALGLILGGGIGNPYAFGMNVLGSGLSAMTGPSKEYGGRYGNVTQTLDGIYNTAAGLVGTINPLAGGIMTLNKGLSNIFGSTSGMTIQDSILGSAFMPAPVKWLNMVGSSKTGTFKNQSWLNTEKADSFMQNAFGNLNDRFRQAAEEAGKTYGTFSHGAKNRALDNINFANYAWDKILAMADQNELQNIRSLYMTSINNLRYALNIQGGWNPLAVGKQGMKILNNATNHNMGMRLLSAAALIDNKQMVLSAQGGTKLYGAKKFRAMSEEELRNRKPEIVVSQTTPKTPEELNAEWERTHPNGGNADPNLSRVSNLTTETFNQTTKPPFTGQEYLEAAEAQRQKKIEKFHEAEKIGEAALMADLAVSAAPLLLRSFRWAFNKAGLLIKVPKYSELSAPEIPIEISNYTGKWKNWVERIQPKLTNKIYDSKKLISIGNASKDKAFLYYKSDEFIKRAKNAGFNDSEIFLLQKELLDMLNHSLVKSSNFSNNGVHAWADAYLDNSGNLYRNATSFEPHVQGFSLEDIISMWDHEFGHVATNMYNSAGRNLGNFMQLVESRYPMIVKMMKYNESITPKFKSELENLYNFWHSSNIETKLKQSYPELSELELKEFVNKYLKFSENIKEYIGNSNELRSRALSTLFAALRKGKSAYLYVLENSEDLNAARELDNIFEGQSLKKYLDNFLNYSVPIITVGGTTYVSTKQ